MTRAPETLSPSHSLVALPAPPSSRHRFLAPDATSAQLIQAAAANHTAWFTTNALALGGDVCHENDATWICTPGEAIIAFPQIPSAAACATLDKIVADCRQRKPGQVSCWSLTPTRPRDLGARLAARGFEWGWKPHWMGLNLNHLRSDFPVPDNLHIAVDDEADWEVDDLPYYSRNETATLRALARAHPRRTWHFGAWQDGKIVGHSILYLTTGCRHGVAGIYSVGVVPTARKQGIGRAVTAAACQFARALGCHYALLNAATNIYSRLGFVSLGYGQTWWMHAPTLAAPPPTPSQVAFVEAVGRGDIKTLSALEKQNLLPKDRDAPLPNGMTPMSLAVQAGKPASAEWLAAHGATLEIIQAWDVSGKERAARLLTEFPELVNRRSGNWQITPLHEAAARGDMELARLLLTARPDPTIMDTEFHSTPLGWARHFQRTEITALLEQYEASCAE